MREEHHPEGFIAIADLGTNTFHLLIAKPGNPFQVVVDEKVFVGLGKGGIEKGHITEEAMQRALHCMEEFNHTCQTWKVQRCLAIGTSAMRSAKNGQHLADLIQERTNFEVRIIQGEEEAALIYEGVKASGVLSSQPSLVVDIGGGSVEFIIGTSQEIFWKRSFEIGGLRLMEKFQAHDPMMPEEMQRLERYLIMELKPLQEALTPYRPVALVGSSGAFDTLIEMELAYRKFSYSLLDRTFHELDMKSFQRMKQELLQKNKTERLAIPGMIPLRVDMIVVAVQLIDVLLRIGSFSQLQACRYALKEGALNTLPPKT
ncbi:MAG: exopolyphosphatase [Cytophagaceae bacterium]|nr:exopolyphosphatase [Cytophagaceae bacterium]